MDALEMHRHGVGRSSEVVAGVGDGQWHDPTPCEDWDVRDLVNHMTVENRWVMPILDGARVDEVDGLEGDLLGDDPIASHQDAARAAQAKAEEIDLDRTVHLSFGDVEARFYLFQRATDMVVHAWDVAVATGQDYTIDEDVARAAYELSAPLITDEVRAAGIFGPEVEVDDDAPWSDRLLGLLGRDPSRKTR